MLKKYHFRKRASAAWFGLIIDYSITSSVSDSPETASSLVSRMAGVGVAQFALGPVHFALEQHREKKPAHRSGLRLPCRRKRRFFKPSKPTCYRNRPVA